ncbi:MAG: SAM-dependent chlorinase/fluorinase [Bacteroidota bacterium]
MIVLLTDFGEKDAYPGIMKGVIAGIAPEAKVVDLSHAIYPQDVQGARFVLWNSYKYFPSGSTFVCVIDPGVGSNRSILAVKTAQHTFIAPDNGLLDYVLAEVPIQLVLRIENPAVWRKDISHTFHGRDIFAPTAAHLEAGFLFTQLGPTHDAFVLPSSPWITPKAGQATQGEIIHEDHFGNLITNLIWPDTQAGALDIGKHEIHLGQTYASVSPGDSLALPGSHGRLEIAVRNGHAGEMLGLKVGDPVQLTLS